MRDYLAAATAHQNSLKETQMPPEVIPKRIQDFGSLLKVELRTICLLNNFILGLFTLLPVSLVWQLFCNLATHVLHILQCPPTEYEWSFSGCYQMNLFAFAVQFCLMGLFVCSFVPNLYSIQNWFTVKEILSESIHIAPESEGLPHALLG